MSDTPKPWADLTVDEKLERLREADRDLWHYFLSRLAALDERINALTDAVLSLTALLNERQEVRA